MTRSIRRPARPLRPLVAALMLVVAANAADAQTVFRCGPDGREWQQHPCGTPTPPGGGAMEPSAEDRAAAIARAKKDAATADRMERERLAREREEARNAPGAVGIGSSRPVTTAAKPDAKSTAKKKSSKHASGGYKPGPATGDFSAVSPGTATKSKKR